MIGTRDIWGEKLIVLTNQCNTENGEALNWYSFFKNPRCFFSS